MPMKGWIPDPRTKPIEDLVPFAYSLPMYGFDPQLPRFSAEAKETILFIAASFMGEEIKATRSLVRRALTVEATEAIDPAVIKELEGYLPQLEQTLKWKGKTMLETEIHNFAVERAAESRQDRAVRQTDKIEKRTPVVAAAAASTTPHKKTVAIKQVANSVPAAKLKQKTAITNTQPPKRIPVTEPKQKTAITNTQNLKRIPATEPKQKTVITNAETSKRIPAAPAKKPVAGTQLQKNIAAFQAKKGDLIAQVKGFIPGSQLKLPPIPATKNKRKAEDESSRPLKRVVSISPTSPGREAGSSGTLAPDQVLPKDAYFESKHANEKLAWACGIRHCLGIYYNSGDRKFCRGCGTNITTQKSAQVMDFFLPPSTFTFQSTTAYVWKPSPLSKKPRVSTYGSHNSIAKDAFWASSLAGLNDDDARAAAVEALHSSLAPKPPKALVIIERKPTPPLPIDNGPHPSGSSTMEHGQDLPTHASFERFSSSDSFAWRCDITHALGRYYMAGDKKCCPGCGSHFNGGGRKRVMDFFLPSGYVVRQIAPLHLQDWQAGRKPKTKKGLSTHNQMANLNYWNIIDEQGLDHEDACKLAIQMTDEYLDRQAKSQIKRDEEKAVTADEHHQVDDDDQEEDVDMDAANEAHQPGPLVFSLAPQDDDLDMKDIMDLSDDSGSEESDSGTLSRDPTPDTSSDDETSGSDSE